MPCILKVRVIEGRNVHFPERSDLQALNTFVEIKFASNSSDHSEFFRTSVAKRSEQLMWNEDFRFEIVDEAELQAIPLSLKLYDGAVFIAGLSLDLNPLLCSSDAVINGFFPLTDTVNGVLGEIHIQVKLLYFGETGALPIKFFAATSEPDSYQLTEVIGLVDVMLQEKDPEYHWSDSFRATRVSNEARSSVILRLNGELKDIISKKVTEMGGNAVVAYSHSYDFEPFTTSIVARAIGTAVKLVSHETDEHPIISASQIPTLPATMELFTINSLPASFNVFLRGIGGLVSSKAVKLLTGNESKSEREQWLFEIREGIKSNTKALKCTHVIGYSESITVSNDLLIIYAYGTAVHLNVSLIKGSMFVGDESFENEIPNIMQQKWKRCFPFHIPYNRKRNCPFERMMDFTRCNECKKRHVPQILLSSIETPYFYLTTNDSTFQPNLVDAYVCRGKKTKDGENNASLISDALPFIEYDLHRQLIYKMRLKGFNVLFDVSVQFEVSDDLFVAVAMGTGYFIHALPRPTPLKISRSLDVKDDEDRELIQMQEKLMSISTQNREAIDSVVEFENSALQVSSDTSTSSEDDEEIIEIDDDRDEDLMSVLMDPEVSNGFIIVTIRPFPYIRKTAFGKFFSISLERSIVPFSIHTNKHFASIFKELFQRLQALYPSVSSSLNIYNLVYSVYLKKNATIVVDISGVAYHESFSSPVLDLSPGNSLHCTQNHSNFGIFSALNIREKNSSLEQFNSDPLIFDGHSEFSKGILNETLTFLKACAVAYSVSTLSSLRIKYMRHDEEPNYLMALMSADFCK